MRSSKQSSRRWVAAAAVALLIAALHSVIAAQSGEKWVGTWATSEVGRPQNPPAPPATPQPPPFMPSACPAGGGRPPAGFMHFTNQTLRQIVHTTVGGAQLRVVFSNAFGTAPLTIGAASVARRDKESAIVAASARPLAFGGRSTVTVPAGALMLSDAVALAVPAPSDLAIDVYLPATTNIPSPLTMHGAAHQTSYVSETGNHAGVPTFPAVATTTSWFALTRVDVASPSAVEIVAAFGDSITDGTASTTDANLRWPDVLARRLAAEKPALGVVNAGIGGNRMLSEGAPQAGINALARFDRDVVDVPGVTHVIVLEGINDIGNARENSTPTAQDLIVAHKQLIERAHLRGVRIFGGTLTPFEGANYYTAIGEAKRQALNDWIRTARAYDGVVDFDAATRDPAHAGRLLAAYDSGDHLHPNDAGYKAMGDAVDLALFRAGGTNPSNGPGRSKR
jgi:lysophospholipase L1-like esterase